MIVADIVGPRNALTIGRPNNPAPDELRPGGDALRKTRARDSFQSPKPLTDAVDPFLKLRVPLLEFHSVDLTHGRSSGGVVITIRAG